MSKNISRREALIRLTQITGVAVVASKVGLYSTPAFAQRRGKSAGGEPNFVTPGKGMASSVNYVEKHSDIKDAKLKTTRMGVPFEGQSCSNCMLYKKTGDKDGKEYGTCTLFQGQVVKGEAWCASWSKKG